MWIASSQVTVRQPVVVSDHRCRRAVGRVHEPVRVATLHAQMTSVHRRVERGDAGDDALVAGADLQFASHTAVRARRARPACRQAQLHDRAILERTRRARVDTRAARHARALDQRVGPAGHDVRARAPPRDLPRELALHLVTDAHTPEAVDAAVHVDRDARMRVVPQSRDVVTGRVDVVALQQAMKRLVRGAEDRAGWDSGEPACASTPARADSISAGAVSITMPGRTRVAHDATGCDCPSTRTRHIRHSPYGSNRRSSHNDGTSIPARSNACRTVRSSATSVVTPSTTISTTEASRIAPESGQRPSTRGTSGRGRRRLAGRG